MKKIILISIIILGLTGCNSGHLTNTCVKEETAGSLKTIITYTIGFKNDKVDKLDITYEYQDDNINTISVLKLSTETLNQNLKPAYDILLEEDKQYKIVYHITSNSKEEVKDYFKYPETRSKFVKELKEQDFTCK